MHRWILGGLVGALPLSVVWVGVGYVTQYEIGWLAVIGGFFVGLGVRYGAHLGGQEESALQGVVACVIAVGSVVAAKFALFTILVGGMGGDELDEFIDGMHMSDEAMIASLADETVYEMLSDDQTINWPANTNIEDGIDRDEYPVQIWQAAEADWNKRTPDEKEAHRQATLTAIKSAWSSAKPSFADVFSPIDALWFLLAAAAAFKVAVGAVDDD